MSKASYENFKEGISWNLKIHLKESKIIRISKKKSESLKGIKIENKRSKVESDRLEMQIKSCKIQETWSNRLKDKFS